MAAANHRKLELSMMRRKNMAPSVFVSYRHHQKDWVHGRLLPVLRAAGVDVRHDGEFVGGERVVGQMNALQDAAERSLLVLTPEYLESPACLHEMRRAVAKDPDLTQGLTLPVVRGAGPLPPELGDSFGAALRRDLQDDGDAASWDLLLRDLVNGDLGVEVPHWLEVLEDVELALAGGTSVSLQVQGRAAWEALLEEVKRRFARDLVDIDLESASTFARPDLVRTVLRGLRVQKPVPEPPRDLLPLEEVLIERDSTWLVLRHFDAVRHMAGGDYHFFAALRSLIQRRKLTVLFQTRKPFATLLPADHPMSEINSLRTVALRGRA